MKYRLASPDHSPPQLWVIVSYPNQDPGLPPYELLALGLLGNRQDLSWFAGATDGSPSWAQEEKLLYTQDRPTEGLSSIYSQAWYRGYLVDKGVLDTCHNFNPWQNFTTTPQMSYRDYLAEIGNQKKFRNEFGEFPVGTFYLDQGDLFADKFYILFRQLSPKRQPNYSCRERLAVVLVVYCRREVLSKF